MIEFIMLVTIILTFSYYLYQVRRELNRVNKTLDYALEQVDSLIERNAEILAENVRLENKLSPKIVKEKTVKPKRRSKKDE
jgi:regulator of replication initiation timing